MPAKELDRRSQSMAEIRVAIEDLKEESESGIVGCAGYNGRAPAATPWPSYALAGILIAAATAAFWMFDADGKRRLSKLPCSPVLSEGTENLASRLTATSSRSPGMGTFRRQERMCTLVWWAKRTERAPSHAGERSRWGPSRSPDGQSIAYLRRQTPGQKPGAPRNAGVGRRTRFASGQISSAS